jgi:putative tryptophan/tyrosine transport system substrate-binding protein
MRRREFITLLASVAAAWPRIARAQQGERVRLVCILRPISEDMPSANAQQTAFLEGLRQLGWTPGRNVRIEVRWSGGDEAKTRKYAAELIALAPDVIVASGSLGAEVILKATKTIPIVFVVTPDPVGSGYVESVSRPGGNATGFMMFEYNLCGKWLELHAIARFAQRSNGGIIFTASGIGGANINSIIAAAARYKLPAVYIQRQFVAAGGLISHGPNFADQFRRAADYVDRILKGEKPADLPVQAPNKYELAINLKTAKALGLSVPQSLLARADEVIE